MSTKYLQAVIKLKKFMSLSFLIFVIKTEVFLLEINACSKKYRY